MKNKLARFAALALTPVLLFGAPVLARAATPTVIEVAAVITPEAAVAAGGDVARERRKRLTTLRRPERSDIGAADIVDRVGFDLSQAGRIHLEQMAVAVEHRHLGALAGEGGGGRGADA